MNDDFELLPLEELALKFGAIKRVYENSPGIDRIEFKYEQLFELIGTLLSNERKLLCERIRAADKHSLDGDYMMDSEECIKVILGEWKLQDWGVK